MPPTTGPGADGATPSRSALSGIRVLDLTQVMSGPYCTMILADLGADVIKIENPEKGDQTRASWGYSVIGEDSRAFLSLNRNKRSVGLDLKNKSDLDAFFALVRTADVVIENFRPGVAERLGIGYDAVREQNPRIIYASISGFGQTGPYSQYPGYDLIAQAMSGVMSVMGEEGGAPMKSAIPIADLGAGMFCAIGILGAVVARGSGPDGQYLETSLFEAALAMSVWESTEYWSTGRPPKPLGSANRMSAPYQALATSDGFLTLGANSEKFWRLLCETLGADELVSDPRFADNNRRMDNRTELVQELERRLAGRTTEEWVDLLLARGVPAGPIRDYRQVLTEDPHVRAREMVTSFEHPVEGVTMVLGSPLKLTRTPVRVRTPPPLLGQHNDEVLREIGAASGLPSAGRDVPAADAGRVGAETVDGVLTLTLEHPTKRNALTWSMYEQLDEHLAAAATDRALVAVVLTGGGDDGFAAGTDIAMLTDLRSGEDGLAYERRVGRVLEAIRSLPVPTIAAVRGPAVGAGLAIAASCDIILAERGAVFGAPIVRTVGNCLPSAVIARVAARMGAARATGMLLTASLIPAEELVASGFVLHLSEPGGLPALVETVLVGLRRSAPLSVRALTESVRRVEEAVAIPSNDDLLAQCYGSSDFGEGVRAFLVKERPEWRGQ